jgi:hypothetical protein
MDENILIIAALAFVSIAAYLVLGSASGGGSSGGGSGVGNPENFDQSIVDFANAIAGAENANPNYLNPGDLKVTSASGAKLNLSSSLTAGATGTAPNGVTQYDSSDDGWNALYNQVQFIVNGSSQLANLSNTISDLAYNYTTTNPDEWAASVGQYMRNAQYVDANGQPVDENTTPLGDFLQ